MKIQVKLKDIIRNDKLIEQTGVNPYCINEGADPEKYVEVEVISLVVQE
jgi:hypothetical protein